MIKSAKRLILIELNEINFDIVEKYIDLNEQRFPALAKLISGARIRTISETSYENLEPWIQWPSVHTVKTFDDHKIFRLGDIINGNNPQIFELLEQAGYKVGVISAMNAENRLKCPSYFIPDPWTQTPSDGSWWTSSLTDAIRQAVNDNAQSRITLKSRIQIILAIMRFASIKNYPLYFKLFVNSLRKSWMKPLVLDLLLHDVHRSMFNFKKPDFSTLFLNAGAHIQHHYMYNAEPLRNSIENKNPDWYVRFKDDPVADVLILYDKIIGDYYLLDDIEIILATGLSQKPYDILKFYYRINSHIDFLKDLGINFSAVYPRMTRDFLIEFEDELQALSAQTLLSKIEIQNDGLPLFGEIDNRGKSLFVTLTYPKEITHSTSYVVQGQVKPLKSLVSFVAIKNGMHQAEGFAFFTPGLKEYIPSDMSHVSNLGKTIMKFFNIAK